MIDLFKTKAEAVSGEVLRFPGKNEALSFILDFLKKEGISEPGGPTAVWADCHFLRKIQKDQLSLKVPGLRFDVTRETASAAKIGINQMEWAIADTGTLVQNATAVEQRLVSSLPDIHIALIPSHKIIPDLATALSKISPADAAYLTFITGPSRTADIERVLTIGVHGPERLIIVFVDQLEE
ncbi:MAG: lactate utilization protein [Dehalococcoidales bacterium]|nr:lactate utilization protein [Dehalococcoidales bacterium]